MQILPALCGFFAKCCAMFFAVVFSGRGAGAGLLAGSQWGRMLKADHIREMGSTSRTSSTSASIGKSLFKARICATTGLIERQKYHMCQR